MFFTMTDRQYHKNSQMAFCGRFFYVRNFHDYNYFDCVGVQKKKKKDWSMVNIDNAQSSAKETGQTCWAMRQGMKHVSNISLKWELDLRYILDMISQIHKIYYESFMLSLP